MVLILQLNTDLPNFLQVFHFLIKRITHFGRSFTGDHRRRRRPRTILTAGERCTLRMKVTSE